MKRIGTGALLLVLLAAYAGCTSEAYNKSILARANTLRTSPEYRIGEGDALTVVVLGHEEYEARDVVRPDGKISFPQHGDVMVAGKTTEAVRQELQESFQQSLGLKNPKVYVAVNSFDSKNITVMGEVLRPGRYPYTGQMRVADVLGLAVGPTVRTWNNHVLLFREVDGATKIYQVKVKDFFRKGDFATNFYMRPGDILFAPRRPAAKLGDEIRVLLDPVKAIFETIGLGSTTVTTFVGAAP
ncbi:MAG: polysaccharide biosynthesis/export family protein [Planctomycetota bacterium]|jgi:polysaccharide export outer membrane protein